MALLLLLVQSVLLVLFTLLVHHPPPAELWRPRYRDTLVSWAVFHQPASGAEDPDQQRAASGQRRQVPLSGEPSPRHRHSADITGRVIVVDI